MESFSYFFISLFLIVFLGKYVLVIISDKIYQHPKLLKVYSSYMAGLDHTNNRLYSI